MAEKEEARLELQKEEEISLPSCSYYLDRAVYCITPGHQMTYYYRRGEADRCKGTWSDFMHCLRAKSMAEEEGLKYLKNTRIDPSKKPHVADVWEYKETPGW